MKNSYFLLPGFAVSLLLYACNNTLKTAGGDAQLEGTSWKLTDLSSFPGELPSAKAVTMQLDTGRVSGNGGCNRYFGSYSLSGTSLRFNGVASTKMFCEGVMEVEDGLMQSINNTDGYYIRGKWLALLRGTDTLARFQATGKIEK